MRDISIIIPTYQPGCYIFQCLNSIYAQQLSKDRFEVIIILNGCNQPWDKEINKWIDSHSDLNVSFIQTDIGGVSNARNIGINHAKGRYLTFIDDDDYISASYLSDMLQVSDSNTVVLSNSYSFNDEDSVFDENYPLRKCFFSLKGQSSIGIVRSRSIFNGPCMKLIPRSIANGVRFNPKLKNGEDSLYMFEISKNISSIKLAPETAIYYRRFRNNSATTRIKSLGYRINVSFNLLYEYTRAYLKAPLKYNLFFYLSRIAATIKGHLLS